MNKSRIGIVTLPAVPFLFSCFLCLISEELSRIPPAANFLGICWVGNIYYSVNKILKSHSGCGKVEIFAPVIGESVNSSTGIICVSGCPEGKLFRMFRIFLKGENMNSSGSRGVLFRSRSVKELKAVSVGNDH